MGSSLDLALSKDEKSKNVKVVHQGRREGSRYVENRYYSSPLPVALCTCGFMVLQRRELAGMRRGPVIQRWFDGE